MARPAEGSTPGPSGDLGISASSGRGSSPLSPSSPGGRYPERADGRSSAPRTWVSDRHLARYIRAVDLPYAGAVRAEPPRKPIALEVRADDLETISDQAPALHPPGL